MNQLLCGKPTKLLRWRQNRLWGVRLVFFEGCTWSSLRGAPGILWAVHLVGKMWTHAPHYSSARFPIQPTWKLENLTSHVSATAGVTLSHLRYGEADCHRHIQLCTLQATSMARVDHIVKAYTVAVMEEHNSPHIFLFDTFTSNTFTFWQSMKY